MVTANRKEEFGTDIGTVWEIVTNLDDYAWRSDLDRIEIREPSPKDPVVPGSRAPVGRSFREYTKDGFSTTFTITAFEPLKRYEFDMENENMQGHWIGTFEKTAAGTRADFTEKVTAKKLWMKPFTGLYLANQQKRYMEDLRRKLEGIQE